MNRQKQTFQWLHFKLYTHENAFVDMKTFLREIARSDRTKYLFKYFERNVI